MIRGGLGYLLAALEILCCRSAECFLKTQAAWKPLSRLPVRKQIQNLTQALADALHLYRRLRGKWNGRLAFIVFGFGA